jgi:hypothetical protein
MNNLFKTLLLFASLILVTAAIAADTVTGTVHNMTKGQPAAGDDVVLLRLGQGMQEESRTKTDSQGAFTLNVASLSDPHLLRVVHQGVNYDQGLTGKAPVSVTVYDAVPKVPNLQGAIGLAQIESDGKVLKISEAYKITNTSKPPVTQSRADNFVISVPPKAVFDAAQVRREQGIWLKVMPEPVKGVPGKYLIDFPIRPGVTQYVFTYHVPYQGPTTLHLKPAYPIQRFGVMVPSSMTFKSLRPDAFRAANLGNGVVGEMVAAIPLVGEVPAFTVSGVGSAPEHGTIASAAPPAGSSAPPVAPATSTAASPQTGAHNQAAAAPAQSSKELWLIVGAIVVLLAGSIYVFSRLNRKPAIATAGNAAGLSSPVDALKEELFRLESKRARSAISAEEYAATKEALNKRIERALTHKGDRSH